MTPFDWLLVGGGVLFVGGCVRAAFKDFRASGNRKPLVYVLIGVMVVGGYIAYQRTRPKSAQDQACQRNSRYCDSGPDLCYQGARDGSSEPC